jgi:Family of unknown function (DUF6118)
MVGGGTVTALLVGILISPLLASWLPLGGDSRVAAFIMQADRWRAGGALMEAASPGVWHDLESAAALLSPNKVALAACRDAAAKTKTALRHRRAGAVIK